MEETRLHDVIGIGFGPSNIALAVAFEELQPDIDALFLEERATATWHPGMMFDGSDIQNHPLRDLVTPRNPRSRYTFTNFLFENGRLFEHLNLGMPFPLRLEYAQYIGWVASHFARWVRYDSRVQAVEAITDRHGRGQGYRVTTADGRRYAGRALVVAPGRTPYVPKVFAGASAERVVHLVDYLGAVARVTAVNPHARIAVVGGSQSAVEIILHLARTCPQVEIAGFLRRYGYRLKDTSPFTGEVYFPQFVDLFYHADRAGKRRLRDDLHLTNYSAVDGDVLDELYRTIYQQKLQGRPRIRICRSTDLRGVSEADRQVTLHFTRLEAAGAESETFDLVVLATGFRDIGPAEHQERIPPLFGALLPHLHTDADGCLRIAYDYSVDMSAAFGSGRPCYVNGLCESSHGMGDAGSFSLLSLRSKTIAESISERLALAPARPVPLAPARKLSTA